MNANEFARLVQSVKQHASLVRMQLQLCDIFADDPMGDLGIPQFPRRGLEEILASIDLECREFLASDRKSLNYGRLKSRQLYDIRVMLSNVLLDTGEVRMDTRLTQMEILDRSLRFLRNTLIALKNADDARAQEDLRG